MPPEVKDWCLDQLRVQTRSRSRLEVQATIKRLVDPLNEKSIWQRMTKVQRAHQTFDPTSVCMDAVTAAAEWRRTKKIREAETVKAIRRLQILLEVTVGLIPQINIDTQLMMRNATLLAGDSPRAQVYQAEIRNTGLDQYLPSAVHILQAMHGALQAVPVRHADQPFKVGAANAERTSLIMRLKANFNRQTGSVPNELVAEFVNVTMDRTDTNADIVRKA